MKGKRVKIGQKVFKIDKTDVKNGEKLKRNGQKNPHKRIKK